MKRSILLTLALLLATTAARGDGLLFTFDGDILPGDPGSGFDIFDPCALDCSRRLEDGHFILEWGVMGDQVNYNNFISELNEPPPPTLWVEWQFRSNQPLPQSSSSCDGRLAFIYKTIFDVGFMFQDAVFDNEGVDFALGLDPDSFHTYRFESLDGNDYIMSVDGVVFNVELGSANSVLTLVQFGGRGDCSIAPDRPVPVRNEWDFIRYGTIESGESIVDTDPPAGVLTDTQAAGVTSILVTFDGPNYAYVDDIAVSVTSGIAPNVVATRRLDNGAPNVLEVVLDRELPLNVTTTLTFADGNQTIEYTVVRGGACCAPNGTCADGSEPECTTGTFLHGAVCEGDADADGIDGLCGDACPLDPDNDIDGDGICGDVDDCPRLNPNDANNDGLPDCVPIPTVSAWGATILTLVLLTGGLLMTRRTRAV